METVTIELTVRQATLALGAISRGLKTAQSEDMADLWRSARRIKSALAEPRETKDDLQAQLNELRETIGAIQRDLSEAEKRIPASPRSPDYSPAEDWIDLDPRPKVVRERYSKAEEIARIAEQSLSEAEKETIQSYALRDVDLDPGDFITDMAGNILKRG